MVPMARSAVLTVPVLLALVLGAVAASAEEPPVPELSAEALIEAARVALAAGEPDHAALLLEGVEPGQGDIDDLDFLRGSIALMRGAWQEAIETRYSSACSTTPEGPA